MTSPHVTTTPTAQKPTAARPADRRGGGGRRRGLHFGEAITGWSFAVPYLALFGVFLLGPIVATLVMSLTDFGLGAVSDPGSAQFVGVDNYKALASDPKFVSSTINTGYFVVVGVPFTLALGLLAAVGLNSPVARFRTFFRVGFYTPVVTSIVAVAVVWRFLLDPDHGLVNALLQQIGVAGPNWLGTPSLAMPSIIAMAVWRNLGAVMVIFLAGLQGIPEDLYEAGRIDGTSKWSEFRRITLPLLRPTLMFAAVITSIGYLNVFEEPFVMTGGGPVDRTLTVSLYMYRQGFNFFHLGYASAMAYVLFMVILGITVLQLRLFRSST